jgi:hypothetical protein
MSTINIEVKEAAHYAFKTGKERFGQELDFSKPNITWLENLLDPVYQRFFILPRDEMTSTVISQTANLRGSYLGKVIRLKRGRTRILKGRFWHVYLLRWNFGYRTSGFMSHIRETGSSFESGVS